MFELLFLSALKRYSSAGVLLLRLVVGAFLMWGAWNAVIHPERLREFAELLAKFRFPVPHLMARLSVYAQLIAGAGFITGLFTRWAGVLCAVNFGVTLAMVERFAGLRGAFPTICLIAIGVFLALHGAGRFGLDALLEPSANRRFDYRY
jgi:putative oxidoreductase